MKNRAVFNVTCEEKKGNFFSPFIKEKGKEDAKSQVITYTTRRKNGINLKRIWYKPYFFLWQLLQIFVPSL